MKIKFIFIAFVSASSLFGEQFPQAYSYPKIPCTENCLEADIIVVGGGAAGCILMNQLSENGLFSVLGIEGGANVSDDPAIEAVGLPAFLLAGTGRYKFFWQGWSQTKPMKGLNGRTSNWTTGMCLGGGSAINGLYYGRGSNAVYSRWEKIADSGNWSLDKILATFKELEDYHGKTESPKARGHKGQVSVLQTTSVSKLTKQILLPACKAAFPFLPEVEDYNDPSVENCIDTRAQWFIDPTGKKRVSSATAFLDSDVMTPDGFGVNGHDLRVLFDSVVTKIIFDNDGVARKVQYIKDGQLLEACARKAVVLSGGINSSKILQLSGIGPKKTLKNAGVEPFFINENVGKHLQNHPLIFITFLVPDISGIPPGAKYAFTINNVYLPKVGDDADDPRALQLLFEFFPGGESDLLPVPLLAMGFDLVSPKSEGSVDIQSDNVFQIAAVDTGFYNDPVDLKTMRKCIQHYIKDLLHQLLLRGVIAVPGDPIYTVVANNFSNDSVDTYIKNNTNLSLDIHHFVSHCKMAPLKEGGVVDGETRVYGTQNVFVADNSICPEIPDINTTAAAMMIGLRTSEILKSVLGEKCQCSKRDSHKP